jgi:hypothetical protein
MYGFRGMGEMDGQLDIWLITTVKAGISGTFETKGLSVFWMFEMLYLICMLVYLAPSWTDL